MPVEHPAGLHPTKILAVHLNYRSRAAQRGRVPSEPSYFLKPPSSLSCSGRPIVRPQGAALLAYEGEIAVVIGKAAREVTPAGALAHIAGYAAANDLGVWDLRDCDRGSNLRAKGMDGYTPVGPVIPADGVDPASLVLRTRVNGTVVQDTTGDALLFDAAHVVADLSRTSTLEEGDLVLLGTPAGTGVLHPGDVVEVDVVAGQASSQVRNPVIEADCPLAPYGAMPHATPELEALATGRPGPRNAPLAPVTAQRLAAACTATLSTQLRRRGIEHHAIGGVTSADPAKKVVGFARTLRYVPLREDVFTRLGGAGNAQKAAVETLQPGEVLVIGARGQEGAGTIGDILVLAAQVRGAVGVITDGGVRDAAAVARLDIPTYAAFAHPAVLGRRHVPLEADVPVGCGGCLVMPGDVIVGDADGVVVIPRDLVDDVAAGAEEQESQEAFITERVAAGEPLFGLYPMDEKRLEEYRTQRAAARGEPPPE